MRTNREARKINALSPDELKGLLEIAAKSPRDHAMILVQYFHGLRVSELVNLKLRDLDRTQKVWYLTVARLKNSLRTRQHIWEVKGKPLWNEKKVLADYLDNHRPKGPTEVIFVSKKHDGPLDPAVWNRLYKSYAKAAGLPKPLQHCHCLKHSRAKHLLAGGSDLDAVRQSLGHSSLNSTIIYTSTTDQEAEIAARSALELLP
jgi:type 1 fimbriae regulatory protein FimB